MGKLKINEKFASNYNKKKEKQEFRKLKEKYDGVALSEESSTSESEDEEASAITPQIERDFLKTLALIKSRDPKIYEKDTTFFKEEAEAEANGIIEDRKKPIYLKDYERKRILSRGAKALVSDSESEDETEETRREGEGMTYVKEQQLLKDSFKSVLNEESDGNEEEFLTLRKKSNPEHESIDDPPNSLAEADGETFLKNYVLKREYCDEDSIPSYNDVLEDEVESESEVEREEQFERKFNFRYEEPDDTFIKMYPRTIKESVRRQDDSRKRKRKAREDRKTKEKLERKEEIKKLKNLKRKEIVEKIEKIKEITGNAKVGFLEDDLDGDFDAKTYDMLMQKIYDGEYYEAEENQKPIFEDDEEYYENWDDWSSERNAYEKSEVTIQHDDSEKFEHYGIDNELPNSGAKDEHLNRSKSKFAEVLSKKKPIFNPGEKTFEEYFDEYYKLDYEDMIGDLPVRFKYREVMTNNYGLSTDEILQADDKELNRWCSLGKTCKYLSKDEEMKDRQRYKRKARSQQRKARVFQSVYDTASGNSTAAQKNENNAPSDEHRAKGSLNVRSSILRKTSLGKARRGRHLFGKKFSKLQILNGYKKLSSQRFAAYGLGKKK